MAVDDSETDSADELVSGSDDSCEDILASLDEKGVMLRTQRHNSDVLATMEKGHARASLPRKYRVQFSAHVMLAISVGFWVAVFGLPMYHVKLHVLVFGQRDSLIKKVSNSTNSLHLSAEQAEIMQANLKLSCSALDTGKMRNVARSDGYPSVKRWTEDMSPWDRWNNKGDIWCGFLPRSYLMNWPNVAQFIIFVVYKNTGTTVNNVFRGVFGTALAALNFEFMMRLFPDGASGHKCMWDAQGVQDNLYTVLWYNRGRGWDQKQTKTKAEAIKEYMTTDQGGLTCRAVFDPNGEMNQWLHWASTTTWKERMAERYKFLVVEKCTPGTIVYNDKNYAKYGVTVCMIDVALVLFLFLFTKSSRSIITWGMLWHVNWMMSFMNPDIGVLRKEDDDPAGSWLEGHATDCFVVFFTTCLGALFAIVSTLLPHQFRLRNVWQLHDDCMGITDSITKVWTEAANYLTSTEASAKRWQLTSHIKSIEIEAMEISEHIDGAWWETFDCGSSGNARYLLGLYFATTSEIRSTLQVVKKCVLDETFDGDHEQFMNSIRPEVLELTGTTCGLMWVSVRAIIDGYVDESEAEKIIAQVAYVEEKELALLQAFQAAAPGITEDLSDEQIFIFCLGCWSRKMRDFCKKVTNLSRKRAQKKIRIGFLKSAWVATKDAWTFRDMIECEHLKYALRNWLSIMTVFLMGYYMQGSIFTRYNANMAITLALLSVKEGSHVVDYQNATHRLLGVALGNSLPILIAGLTDLFDCMSWGRFWFQCITIFAYVSTWMFVYFNSDAWGYVGSLVAGLGIFKLMEPCGGMDGDKDLATKYKEIGSAMVAIIVQSILHAALSRTGPRMVFLTTLQKLLDSLGSSFEAFFEGRNLSEFKSHTLAASHQLDRAKMLISECDPKFQFVRGRSPPFKISLAQSAIDHLESMVSEMRLVVKACEDWNKAVMSVGDDGAETGEASSIGVIELAHRAPALKDAEREIMPSFRPDSRGQDEGMPRPLSELVLAMLGSDGDVECDVQEQSHKISTELKSATALYEQFTEVSKNFPHAHVELTDDIRMRLSIVVSCLQNCTMFLGKIEQWCVSESRL